MHNSVINLTLALCHFCENGRGLGVSLKGKHNEARRKATTMFFLPTREDMTNTLTDHDYLIDTRESGLYGIYTDESLLVGILAENDEGEIFSGTYLDNGEWVSASGDDAIEFLCSEANMRRATEEFLTAFDEVMADDNEGEDY